MTEEELRALVRDAIAQHLGAASAARPAAAGPVRGHPSHTLFVLPEGADRGGPCLIEPLVMCNHCGYCRSYGH